MILLTGATGFVGKYVFDLISTKTRCVVRSNTHSEFDDIYSVESINSTTDWEGAFQGINAIIHLAGVAHNKLSNEKDFFDVNYRGTERMAIEAARAGVKRFVFVSTIGVNGSSTTNIPFTEEQVEAPHNAYAKSKHNAEIALKKISENTGMEVVIIRPPLIYGYEAPGNFEKLVKLIKKSFVLPFGLAQNKRSFISVSNLSKFLIHCVDHPKAAGEIFVISDGDPVSIKNLTSAIACGLNKKVIQLPIPVTLIRGVSKLAGLSAQVNQLFDDLEVDSSKARLLLDWEAPETMEQALAPSQVKEL